MKPSHSQNLSIAEQNILRAFQYSRLAHAYLFSGPQLEISLGTALWMAKLLNCLSPGLDSAPCLKCTSCAKIEKRVHPDVVVWEPRGALRVIRIEDVREIKQGAYYKPFEGRAKVHIVSEADALHPSAANAFLKVLEEPPAMTYFILLSHSPDAILPTILSRTQELSVGRVSEQFDLNEFPECDGDPGLLEVLPELSRYSKVRALELVRSERWAEKKELLFQIGEALCGTWTGLINAASAASAQIESELEELEEKMDKTLEDFEKTKEFDDLRKGKIAAEKTRIIQQFLRVLLAWARNRYSGNGDFLIYPVWVEAVEDARRHLERGASIHWALESVFFRVRMAEKESQEKLGAGHV